MGGVGGGVCNNGTMWLRSVTITNNSANNGGGIYAGGTCNIGNSIIAGNSAASLNNDFYSGGSPTSSGFNLIGDNTGVAGAFEAGSPNVNNDIVGTDVSPVDPLLGLLTDNGGRTPMHAFTMATSPAIDKGDSFGLTADQRGSTRPIDRSGIVNGAGDTADIGAFEQQAPTAGDAVISGRLRTAGGRGIAKTYLTLSGGGLAQPLTAMSNAFGFYSFPGVPAGEVYVLTVGSGRSRFTEPVRVIDLLDDLSDIDFIAEP